MTNTRAVQVVNAERLNPFDQEYLDYFTEYNTKSSDEKLSEFHDSHEMFKFPIQTPSLHKEPIMTNISAVQAKNAKRLRPFDQEDKDFFTEFSDKTIGEKISDLQDVYASLDHQLVGIFREYFDRENISQARVVARSARNILRDIKQYELALTKHLEQIEVTGEWK